MAVSVDRLMDIVRERMDQVQHTQRLGFAGSSVFQSGDVIAQLGEFSLESDEGRFVQVFHFVKRT